MEGSFLAVYYLDLDMGTCSVHSMCDYVQERFQELFENSCSHEALLKFYIEHEVFYLDKEKLQPFVDPNYIKLRLEQAKGYQNHVNILFRVERNRELFYRKIRFIATDPNDFRYVVMVAVDVDNEIKEEINFKEWSEEARRERVERENIREEIVQDITKEVEPHLRACKDFVEMIRLNFDNPGKQQQYLERLGKRLDEGLIVMENRSARMMSANVTEAQITEMAAPLAGKRILLVDADKTECERVVFAFEHHGIMMIIAKSSAEAMNILNQVGPDYYDYVIIDRNLPGIDGLRTIQIIRCHRNEKMARIPILMISDNLSKGEEKARAAGANAYIEKPFGIYEMLHALNSI